MDYFIIVVLIGFSALFSGLTLGLMGLSALELKRKMSLGDKNAARVYAVRKRGNLLLATLLIGNVAINSTLAIFLGSIASGLIAGLAATGLIVVFGEIIPQAVFSRFALSLGARIAWFVKIIIFILLPITWPIAWILNKTLGDELATIYSKRELVKIIEEHEDSKESDVRVEEERIAIGALTFSNKKVEDVMTPSTAAVSFEASRQIDEDFLKEIHESGYSRFPVYREKIDNIVGILYLKDLLGSRNLNKTINEVMNKKVIFVDGDEKLVNAFNNFLKTHYHLFVVRNEFGGFVGIITLEDVLEEIIRMEIIDEGDRQRDLRKFAKRMFKRKRKREQ